MLSMNINLFFVLFLGSCLVYTFVYKHILLTLMSLEFSIMNVLVVIFYLFSIDSMYYFCMYFLVFAVCESILGISLLIIIVRYSGNDYVDSVMISKW